MSDNPYSPPAARVADFEPPDSIERPIVVTRAVYLLWASVVLMCPGAIYSIVHPDPEVSMGDTLLFIALYLGAAAGISYWLNTAAWKGRSYARWVLAVMTVVGLLLNFFWFDEIVADLQRLPWYIQSTDVLSTVVGIAGAVMLFAPSANAWYRAIRASR